MNRKILYFILFILNLIVAILLYFILYYRSKNWQLLNNPVGWCSNNWTCTNICDQDDDVNDCFKNSNYTEKGLYECLMYPDEMPCTGNNDCFCPTDLDQTNNCFAGCPGSLDDIGTGSTKCCCTSNTSSFCTPC